MRRCEPFKTTFYEKVKTQLKGKAKSKLYCFFFLIIIFVIWEPEDKHWIHTKSGVWTIWISDHQK